MKRYLAYGGALAALAGSANGVYAADSTDDSLTWFGITLYGTVDVGYTYQNRGVPLNDYFPAGLEYMVQKNATKKICALPSDRSFESEEVAIVEERHGLTKSAQCVQYRPCIRHYPTANPDLRGEPLICVSTKDRPVRTYLYTAPHHTSSTWSS